MTLPSAHHRLEAVGNGPSPSLLDIGGGGGDIGGDEGGLDIKKEYLKAVCVMPENWLAEVQ